jgi:PIN domain nuclease of toxin-antitoxin system
LLLAEPGAEKVQAVLPGALLSAVNFAEVVTKLCERGMPADRARAAIEALGAEVVDFGVELACVTGDLRNTTRSAGLSLGDRACLALSQQQNLPAMTADTAWARIAGVRVFVIRSTEAKQA